MYFLFVKRLSSNILFLESVRHKLLQSNTNEEEIKNRIHKLSEEIISTMSDMLSSKKGRILDEVIPHTMQQSRSSLFDEPTVTSVQDKITLKSKCNQLKMLTPSGAFVTCPNQIASILTKISVGVGIPSYKQGEDIINSITKALQGLVKHFHKEEVVLLGNFYHEIADNASETFINKILDLVTKQYQNTNVYILMMSTGFDNQNNPIVGKGNNVRNFFEILSPARNSGVFKAGAILDADLKTIIHKGEERGVTDEWVKRLLYPIVYPKEYHLPNAADFVSPLYPRHEYDGSLTNNFAVAIHYLITGIAIRQPIGGDFGFSSKSLEAFLYKMDWSEEVVQYGIDIAMSVTVATSELNIVEAVLGDKLHDPSAHKLYYMVPEVFNVMIQLLIKNIAHLSSSKYPYTVSRIGSTQLPLGRRTDNIEEDYKFYRQECSRLMGEPHKNTILSDDILTEAEILKIQTDYGIIE